MTDPSGTDSIAPDFAKPALSFVPQAHRTRWQREQAPALRLPQSPAVTAPSKREPCEGAALASKALDSGEAFGHSPAVRTTRITGGLLCLYKRLILAKPQGFRIVFLPHTCPAANLSLAVGLLFGPL